MADNKKQINLEDFLNYAALDWPTDVWGMTRDFRAAVRKLSQRIDGSPEKTKLVNETLALAAKHLKAKQADEAENRKARAAARQAKRDAQGAENDSNANGGLSAG